MEVGEREGARRSEKELGVRSGELGERNSESEREGCSMEQAARGRSEVEAWRSEWHHVHDFMGDGTRVGSRKRFCMRQIQKNVGFARNFRENSSRPKNPCVRMRSHKEVCG